MGVAMARRMKKFIGSLVVAMAVAAFANTACANLIVNGDFELGNVGFTSGYEFDNSANGLANGGEGAGAGKYSVVSDPNFSHSAFPTAVDHTPGAGTLMMVVNGSGIAGKTVWEQTVAPPLLLGATYAFSFYAMNVYPDSPAKLDVSFGGSSLGTFDLTSAGTDVWTLFTATFTATANNTAGLIDLNLTAFGNDFALDDIALNLVAVPDAGSAVALLGIALTGIEVLRRKIGARKA
jgi:VPDSG-CTERM motif